MPEQDYSEEEEEIGDQSVQGNAQDLTTPPNNLTPPSLQEDPSNLIYLGLGTPSNKL